MAASIDDLIKVMEKFMSQTAADKGLAAAAKMAEKRATAEEKSAKALEKAAKLANQRKKDLESELEDLHEQEKTFKRIETIGKGAAARMEAAKNRAELQRDIAVNQLKTEKAITEEKLAQAEAAGDPNLISEYTKKIQDLDKAVAQKNRTTKVETEAMLRTSENYKMAMEFMNSSIMVYGKHEFANVSMLQSFRSLATVMTTFRGSMEVFAGTLISLTNTMFAFTMQIDTQTHAIMRNTGASRANADAMMANAQALSYFGVTAEDITEAVTSLRTEFQDFTFFTVDTQNEIKNTAVLLDQLGVSFNDSSRAMQNMTVSMGLTGRSSVAAARDLTDFAHIIKVVPKDLMSNFAAAGDSLAKFGDEGISAFKELAIRSKVTTLEVEKMLRMVEKFDTFEGAAEQAGKLNAALGGNFVNAMDLMMTTNPAERFDMIRDAILNTGLTFDDMSYYQRKFFTEAANLESVADLAKVMRGDFSGMAGDVMKSSDEFEKLAERTKAVQDIQQRFKTLLVSFIPVFEPLIKNLEELMSKMSDEEFREMGEGIMGAVMVFAETLVAIIPHLDMIAKAFGVMMLGKGAVGLTKFAGSIGGMGDNIGKFMDMAKKGKTAIGGFFAKMVKSGESVAAATDAVTDMSSAVNSQALVSNVAADATENLTGSMQRNAPAAKGAGKGLIDLGIAALLMGAGIGLAALGVAELVKAFNGLGDAAYPAALGILAFGGALALFMFGMKLLLPVIAAGSVGLGLFTGVVVVLAGAFAGMALATAKAASSIGEMFNAMSASSMDDFKEVMGYFTTGTDGISTGIATVTENIDLLVASINSISADNIMALGDAMTAVSAAASIETTALKNDVKDIMSSINEVSLPKINATTALIGAVGTAATTTTADPMAGFDRRRSTGEKPVVKVYIGDTELKQTIRTEINNRLAEIGAE